MGDPRYEEVADTVSRRKLAAHPASRQAARDRVAYRMSAVFTLLEPAMAMRDRIAAAGAYDVTVDRVSDCCGAYYIVRVW